MSETSVLQSTDYLSRPRPSFFASLKRKADQKCGFTEFRRKFPDLCDSSAQLLPTPQTPCSINTFNDPSSCRLDASANKCPKLQQPNSTMKTMSNSTSHPCLGNSTYKAMCSSEGSSPNAQITQVLDFVFLGSQDDAQDSETLTRNGITKVINLSDTCPKSDLIQNDSHHFMRIPVKDSYDAKLIPHFDQAYDFIEEARQTNQRVLVHCLAGISRSPTLAIAYIMRAKKLTCDEAYRFVKTRRPSVSPNLNFMGQLFLYERHLREQNILPAAARPRSNVIDDFTPTTEINQVTVAEPPKPPALINEKLCKSASADFTLLSNDGTSSENRKRLMDTSFSLPCRPRQLIKNCCTRKNLEIQPQQLPSPSTEFSKLDISLSNPCFGTNSSANPLSFNSQPQQPQTSTQINAENPVFGLIDNKNDKTTLKAKKTASNHHQLLNLFSRRPNNCKLPATRIRCKLSKCYTRHSGQKPSQLTIDEDDRLNGIENVRYRVPRFSRLPARNPVNIMPTLHDDEVDSGKGSSVSHSVSTEEGESQEQPGTASAISTTSATDPECDSVSSASSLEITVQ